MARSEATGSKEPLEDKTCCKHT